MLPEGGCLTNVETNTVSTEAIAEEESVAHGITKVDTEVSTRHRNYHFKIDVEKVVRCVIDLERIVRPPPDVLAHVIEDEQNAGDNDEERHEAPGLRASPVRCWNLWKSIELRECDRDEGVDDGGRGLCVV